MYFTTIFNPIRKLFLTTKTGTRNVLIPFLFILFMFSLEYSMSQDIVLKSDSLLKAANSLLNEGKLSEAEKAFDQIPDKDSNLILAMAGLAKIYYLQCDYFKSRNKFLKALEKDTANMELRYYSAIGIRDNALYNGKNYQYKITFDDESFKKSEKYFKRLFDRDSLYRDAFYQYSLLLKDESKYTEALEANIKQIKLKPDLTEAYTGLNRTLKAAFEHSDLDDLEEYLSKGKDDLQRYLYAELKRYDKKYAEASVILNELLSTSLSFPRILINIARLKIYVQTDSLNKFDNLLRETTDGIITRTDADILFNDIKYIATKEEIKIFQTIKNPEGLRNYLNSFWNRRNPTPVQAANPRIFEHYKRLLYAYDHYWYDREIYNFTGSGNSYSLNFDFTDQGLIYIKHGKPDLINKTNYSPDIPAVEDSMSMEDKKSSLMQQENSNRLASLQSIVLKSREGSDITNESWLYKEQGENQKMIFHFAGLTKYLVPIFLDTKILDDIRTWDNKYNSLFYALDKDQMETQSIAGELITDGEKTINTGLETERTTHNADKEMITLGLMNEVTAFRGSAGYTKLETIYLLPTSLIFKRLSSDIDSVRVECGYGIFNLNWNELHRKIDTISIFRKTDSKDDKLRFFTAEIKADYAGISIFFRPIDTKIYGSAKKNIQIPDFSKKILNISDIQLASKIEKSAKRGWFYKNGLTVIPSPTLRQNIKEKINIYYEIYNLTQNSDGKTIYQIEYILKFPKTGENILSSLFSKDKDKSTSTEYSRVGKETTSIEYISFDVSKLEKGNYTIEVKVRDINSRRSIIRSRDIVLY